MTETRIYPDPVSMAAGLAEQVALELSKAIKKRGAATLAVPGGETPKEFFAQMRNKDIDWSAITIIMTDECYVPESSERSNAHMVRELFLQDKAAKATFISFYNPDLEPQAAIDALLPDLEAALPIDVCILGMGPDMHTANLFVNAKNVEEALGLWAPNIMIMDDSERKGVHLSLTAPVLERARKAHMILIGEEKKKSLREAQKVGQVEEAPVRIILNRARATTIHYADDAS